MKEFMLAALPWVLTGIPLAILCAGFARKEPAEQEKKREERMALGAAMGLLWAVALNSLGLWESHALGFAVGPLWGMALSGLFRDEEEDPRHGDADGCCKYGSHRSEELDGQDSSRERVERSK